MIFPKKANPKVVAMYRFITEAATIDSINEYLKILESAKDNEYTANEFIFLVQTIKFQREFIIEVLTENDTVS